MPELAPRLREVAEAVRKTHPRVELLGGGQAAFPPEEGVPVPDLETLLERLEGRAR